ncbi:MAG: HD domain-containing protein [Candidatus Omnitrophica bacterium]|nr:HD domain-containing protein [Candidatus Omnitrophota bacterium]
MAQPLNPFPERKRGPKLVSIEQERLERRLVIAFGFMSLIPILFLYWATTQRLELRTTLLLTIASALFGYFFIARRMIHAVVEVTQKVKALISGDLSGELEEHDANELGELARAFNKITKDLRSKIEALESSRDLVKKLLSRIGTAIVSYEGIDNLLSLIVENASSAMEAQLGSLMLVDGEKQELSVKAAWSTNGRHADQAFRLPLGEGLPGWVAREGRSMRGKAMASALGFANTEESVECAALCVPLKLRDHAIGVVTVLRERGAKPFTEDDETLLTSIGAQIAVAIENYRLNLDVERTYVETIMALALAVEAKDPYSAGHSKRVGFYATKLGKALGLDEETLHVLNHAGVLHDIGKIGIKDEILLKPTALTPDEMKIMQQHPLIGEAILKPVRSLQKVVPLVRHHHERYDGGGYPAGLKGDDIPLGARIISVVDTYDAMVTDRPYRKRLSVEEARAELRRYSGTQYDPALVAAFLDILNEKEMRLAAAKATGQKSS